MKAKEALLDRLKAAQLTLIETAAKSDVLPSDNTLAKLADLELAIAAVENAIDSN